MATLDLGKIKQVWRGTYNNSTAYVVDDLVEYTDNNITSTYICVANSTGNAPSTGGTAHASWNFVAKGVVDPIPSQSGNAGKFLKTDGTNLSYGNAGITMSQTWRLTSGFGITSNSGGADITSNFEVADTYGYGSVGGNTLYMSQSSGIFTFPSTGIYLIQFCGQHTTSAVSNWSQIEIRNTTDNGSNWNICAYGYAAMHNGGAYQSSYCQFQFDVTDTSNYKIKFAVQGSTSNTSLVGSSNQNQTVFHFIKLADT